MAVQSPSRVPARPRPVREAAVGWWPCWGSAGGAACAHQSLRARCRCVPSPGLPCTRWSSLCNSCAGAAGWLVLAMGRGARQTCPPSPSCRTRLGWGLLPHCSVSGHVPQRARWQLVLATLTPMLRGSGCSGVLLRPGARAQAQQRSVCPRGGRVDHGTSLVVEVQGGTAMPWLNVPLPGTVPPPGTASSSHLGKALLMEGSCLQRCMVPPKAGSLPAERERNPLGPGLVRPCPGARCPLHQLPAGPCVGRWSCRPRSEGDGRGPPKRKALRGGGSQMGCVLGEAGRGLDTPPGTWPWAASFAKRVLALIVTLQIRLVAPSVSRDVRAVNHSHGAAAPLGRAGSSWGSSRSLGSSGCMPASHSRRPQGSAGLARLPQRLLGSAGEGRRGCARLRRARCHRCHRHVLLAPSRAAGGNCRPQQEQGEVGQRLLSWPGRRLAGLF